MLSANTPIPDLAGVREHLQFAIGLELATIPLYLTALYSIPDGQNTAASRVIQSVVMEEMLHMALAANVLNAIGGEPSTDPIDGVEPIVRFPGKIPFLDVLGPLHLQRFSPEALTIFQMIEHPASLQAACGEDSAATNGSYGSIGAFYQAIEAGIEAHCPKRVFSAASKTRAGCQVEPEEFYGGGSSLTTVCDKASALLALRKIVDQGEGYARSEETAEDHAARTGTPVTDGDVFPDGWQLYSHFARFKEISEGRRFTPKQTASETPRGDVLPIDWSEVYPMADDPSAEAYASTEIEPALHAFNATFTSLIDALYAAFNGDSRQIRDAVTTMWALKYEAQALMKTPSPLPGHEGLTVGPPFAYQRSGR